MSPSWEPVQILLVEDSEADIELTTEALADARVANDLHVTRDGVEALAFLRNEPPHEHAPTPDLVLLDLNLPRKDGREVLEEVKADPQLRQIPIVVLTTSSAEADVLRSYELHANSYITKPVRFDDFLRTVASLEDFWLTVVKLPSRSQSSGGSLR